MSAFEIIDEINLAELNAKGIWARHKTAGAEVFHILNDDEENLFAFAFATAAKNSTGVAHILEHCVLCGSKNYPLKDPFIVLAQGSLQTYLNAWTFPDKTVYPASSVNKDDYFNLMSVYGDAVFRPNLDLWTFRQEGHRLEFDFRSRASGGLIRNGIVFNEMKGAYSSPDEYAQHWAIRSVMPDTVYAQDSGGEPSCIPNLSYDEFCAFHRKNYAPANCRIFLCGNIPTREQLDFLDEKFFKNAAAGSRAETLSVQRRWNEPRVFNVSAPKDSNDKATVFLSWLCGAEGDNVSRLELFALTEVLLGHDGSPLMRALIESDLGEDIATVSGADTELREPVFAVGLRGVDAGTPPEKIEKFIIDELSRLVREGIPDEEVEAALHSLEFSNREVRRPGGPWSLVLMRRALRGWIYSENPQDIKPWESMLFNEPFAALKSKIRGGADGGGADGGGADGGGADGMDAVCKQGVQFAEGKLPKQNPHGGGFCDFFEKFIEERLIKNPHRALVCVRPQEDFLKKEEERYNAELAAISKSLSFKDRRVIKNQNAELKKKQNANDPPEFLAKIPHVKLESLQAGLEKVPLCIIDSGGLQFVSTKLWTNGISYFDIVFPLEGIDYADYVYLPLFCHTATALGLPGMDYAEVSSRLARSAGSFFAMLNISGSVPAEDAGQVAGQGVFSKTGRDWIMFRLKCLDEKLEPSLELALRLIYEADFSDEKRLRDLILEYKNDIETSLAPNGSHYAVIRAQAGANPVKARIEVTSGITQYEFARTLETTPVSELAKKFTAMRDKFIQALPIVHITCEDENKTISAFLGAGKNILPQNPKPEPQNLKPETQTPYPLSPNSYEIFSSPALQVGFSAMNFTAAPYSSAAQTHEQALSHFLSTGALWETIRMKGGAYGARCSLDPLQCCWTLSTYRDPKPAVSLELFTPLLKKFSKVKLDAAQLGKIITGSYIKIKHPATGAQKGFAEFCRLLCGITHESREQKLRNLLALREDDLRAAAAGLAARGTGLHKARKVIITSPGEAVRLAKKYKCSVHSLV